MVSSLLDRFFYTTSRYSTCVLFYLCLFRSIGHRHQLVAQLCRPAFCCAQRDHALSLPS